MSGYHYENVLFSPVSSIIVLVTALLVAFRSKEVRASHRNTSSTRSVEHLNRPVNENVQAYL